MRMGSGSACSAPTRTSVEPTPHARLAIPDEKVQTGVVSLIDDAIAIQHYCLLGLHRWAMVALTMPNGQVRLMGGEICLDCHERKPEPGAASVIDFPTASRTVSVRQAGRLRTADATA